MPDGSKLMSRGAATLAFKVMVLGLCGMQLSYAEVRDTEGKTIDISQVKKPPVIDGVLDDDAWTTATIVENLHEITPNEYQAPSQKSQVYIVYTADAIYVAARLFDSQPEKIGANVLRQGDFSWGEDAFRVILDPFNKQRSGYAFELSANAVRHQAIYNNVTSANWTWSAIWHGATTHTDEGWIAEIEIPFKTLSFDPSNETWGLNLVRYIGREAGLIGWVSSNRAYGPSASGKMDGLTGMRQGMGLDVVPGIRSSESKDYLTGTTTSLTEPSLDLFYKITPALTGALTVNTDFSGTGVDQRQINLTRFGLFFPERRKFFMQDSDIFEFGLIGGREYESDSTLSVVEEESGRPFFSRKIGLGSRGETIDLNVGGKITGRIGGGVDVGVLAIQQDGYQGLESSDIFAARISTNVLEESSVGLILTHGDPTSNLDNTVAGLDFRYLNTRLVDGRSVEAGFWYQQSDTENLNGNDAAYGFSLSAPNSTGLRGGIGFKEVQQNFNPALGFVNRPNVRDLTVEAGYTWYPDTGAVRNIFSGFDFERIEKIQGDLQSQYITLRPIEVFNNLGDSVSIHYRINDEVVDAPFEISEGVFIQPGSYEYKQLCADTETSEFRKVSVIAYYCGGDFYNGVQDSTGAAMKWRPNKHISIIGRYDYNDIELPGGTFVTRLISLRANIAFTNAWYWENFMQYDNISYSLGVNSILRWFPRAGREMVFVINREYIDFIRQQHFNRVSGDINFKFSYTFRF